jgi:hypothetical protein
VACHDGDGLNLGCGAGKLRCASQEARPGDPKAHSLNCSGRGEADAAGARHVEWRAATSGITPAPYRRPSHHDNPDDLAHLLCADVIPEERDSAFREQRK